MAGGEPKHSALEQMKITEGLEVLDLTIAGSGMVLHPVIVGRKDDWALVDTGMPGLYEAIMKLAGQAGFEAEGLTAIILTHQDVDHVGSLPKFLGMRGDLKVWAHAEDRPYIDGEIAFLKMRPQVKEMLSNLLAAEEYEQFKHAFSKESAPQVTELAAEGDVLPYGGGLTVIHTPGHTPGHISLYHADSKTLLVGDALTVNDGELCGPNPPVTPDMEQALKSVRKFLDYEIETVVCYHGGSFTGDIPKRIEELTADVK
ncbi:MBL fold metallo-hydrolase [Paenibacillus chibensis]|uniref:MBL fold metallo-hydrolase n=1 Tax=Paenibacillus chibensis TaxID=59846 RepID=UPI001FEBF256|nr:MBL fold metallo-hydrolase [Paenibacillus chibensis]MEC0372375.1 MBL fold metallo-hydrolase [Paenibacillus chibensis]